MKASDIIGGNRTGTALAPERLAEMIDATEEFPPTSKGNGGQVTRVRSEYIREAEAIGSLPPPAGLKQLTKTALKAVKGGKPNLLMDKLGERLAFERTGVRLYEALALKHQAAGGFSGGPDVGQLKHILDEELEHFGMLKGAIERLGGDPTAVTPSADVHAVASSGLGSVLADPRTSFLACLEAALVAELVDNDCWDALIALAEKAGEDDLVAEAEQAREQEREHLACVRRWLAIGQGRPESGRESPAGREPGGQRRTMDVASLRTRGRRAATGRRATAAQSRGAKSPTSRRKARSSQARRRKAQR